ncbi:MAG TPA: PsbP-related protein [Cytophagaceae bacterium]|jgi:hypothetical protein|nr:PsbP-related protein [Cytophagaceae bacterium]
MKIKITLKIIAILLITTSFSFGQTPTLDQKIDELSYSIKYPSTWKIDNTGRNGITFLLFAEKESQNDNFGENINLLIQDLHSMNLDLDKYTQISEEQIKANGNLIESKRISKNRIDSQQLTYEALFKTNQLKFRQYYFLKDEKAYILTFTATTETYDKYIEIAEKIMNTFKVK